MGIREKVHEKLGSARRHLCSRKLDVGDVVQVEAGDWTQTRQRVGGVGRWAIYVGARGDKSQVRPLLPDGSTAPAVVVDGAVHLDDVIAERAIAKYKADMAAALDEKESGGRASR